MGFVKDMIKINSVAGWIYGHSFPVGAYINNANDENEKVFIITYPNKKEEIVSHDIVKCATVLAMGVIDIDQRSGKGPIYGTKYLVLFKDGRQGVITANLGNCKHIESVLF